MIKDLEFEKWLLNWKGFKEVLSYYVRKFWKLKGKFH